jgi:cytochrome d ubiquinol oxidase subunit I
MRTEDAVTGAAGIPVGYATLVVVYVGLIAAVAWIRRQLARVPLEIDYEAAPEALDRAG